MCWNSKRSDKSAFSSAKTSLKSKTNTNEQLLGHLVYHEITQINERSFFKILYLRQKTQVNHGIVILLSLKSYLQLQSRLLQCNASFSCLSILYHILVSLSFNTSILLYPSSRPSFLQSSSRPCFSILHHVHLSLSFIISLFVYPLSHPCFPILQHAHSSLSFITSQFSYPSSRPYFPILHHVNVSPSFITSQFSYPSSRPCFPILHHVHVSLSFIKSLFLCPSLHVLISLSFITSLLEKQGRDKRQGNKDVQ